MSNYAKELMDKDLLSAFREAMRVVMDVSEGWCRDADAPNTPEGLKKIEEAEAMAVQIGMESIRIIDPRRDRLLLYTRRPRSLFKPRKNRVVSRKPAIKMPKKERLKTVTNLGG